MKKSDLFIDIYIVINILHGVSELKKVEIEVVNQAKIAKKAELTRSQ